MKENADNLADRLSYYHYAFSEIAAPRVAN